MFKKFQRNTEDFVCEHCKEKVTGNGYTNHCPKCLYSKHVDINPGDRLNSCGGLMKPLSISTKDGEYVITHLCLVCGFKKNNRTAAEDDFETILKVVRESV